MFHDPESPRSWHEDPLVWFAAIVAVAAHANMLFVGRYLPFIDWSNHVGLIAILANGGETGALAYAERSFAPTPYWLFYMTTAAVAQVVSVEAAAKIVFLLASFAMPLAGAYLAQAFSRSPRLGAIAPLALSGFALGYGFASFVFTLPLVLFTLGAAERLLCASEADRRRATLRLAALLVATYLGHALLFGFVVVALFARIGFALLRDRADVRPFVLAALPSGALTIWTLASTSSWRESGAVVADHWATFERPAHTLATLGRDLLQRGDDRHDFTMLAALALLVAHVVGAIVRRQRGRFGLEIYAALAILLYAFGPMTLERPVQVWMVAPRFATLAALFVFVLPPVDLRGRWGIASVVFALSIVVVDAQINRATIAKFNRIGRYYDPVRRHIPRGSTFLALTLVPPGDVATFHPAARSLFFHHLSDGAAYTAYLFDNPLHPVRPKKEGRPRAPFWRDVSTFDPTTHGVDFDYLILRGAPLVERTEQAGLHKLVAEENGWFVFRSKVRRRP